MFTSPEKNVIEFGFIPGQKVVDVGSGAGHYSMALSTALGPSGKVIAVDIDKEMLGKLKNESVRSGRDNIEVINGNIEKKNGTKLRESLVDGVVLSNILFQLGNLLSAIEEVKRILKPGGRVCIVEWSDLSLVTGKSSKIKATAVPQADAKTKFESAGFVFERLFPAGESHYGLIMKKPLQ